MFFVPTDNAPVAGPSTLRNPTRPFIYETSTFPKLPTKHALSASAPDVDSFPRDSANNEGGSSSRHAQSLSLGSGADTIRPPRISKLLGAVLNGSRTSPTPYTISHPRPRPSPDDANEIVMVDGSFAEVSSADTVTRPPSPAPTADFSFISPPSPMSFVHVMPPSHMSGLYDVFSSPTSGPEGTPNCTLFISPSKGGGSGSMRRSSNKLSRATLGRIWGALSSPARRTRTKSQSGFDGLPLDGEEGELIDEACFIAMGPTTGMDIVGCLPTEVALTIFALLDLQSALACRSVCRRWTALADDSLVWRALFYREIVQKGWRVNERKARRLIDAQQAELTLQARMRLLSLMSVNTRTTAESSPARPRYPRLAPLALDWQRLYRTRAELDRRWTHAEPRTTRIIGHEDSVYCLEFDARRLVTGSRDRTIKVWDLETGRLRATLRGHAGSVLCLKFDKAAMARADAGEDGDTFMDGCESDGIMVSGSSDCTVLVWDLRKLWRVSGHGCANAAPITAGPELVKRVLRGHTGGVLDLRLDSQWIVSCSKDGLIRVWDRRTLTLAQTLAGHEGPVNAVGLQGGLVVSASGDGKMMLWDIVSGSRVRTFEGHDRGLACIEFKGDLIVSGSNDCKIKVWRASTGACLATLSGHTLLVRALAFDPHSQRLVSASYDKTVKVWDLSGIFSPGPAGATGRVVREFRTHESHIFDVKFDVRRIVRRVSI
ncbi:WD40 repeat-like protein [Phellopilus nigrolimitatus]|nr:WD40 repeat-like protein [Phellopilus nigrolimitatus]